MRLVLPVALLRTTRSVRLLWISAAACIGCLLLGPSAASAAYTFGSEVEAMSPLETVFDHEDVPDDPQDPLPPQHCDDQYLIQDAATRAFRDSSGQVQLIMSHAGTPGAAQGHTRRFTGQTLAAFRSPSACFHRILAAP
jgi:hypothetical protein